MSSSRRYRLALMAYPRPYRDEYGNELVATAHDLNPSGWSLRQAWSLLAEGLRTRARTGADSSPKTLWSQGMTLGLVLIVVPIAAYGIIGIVSTHTVRNPMDATTVWLAGLGGTVILALLSWTRWLMAVTLTAWITALAGWSLRGPTPIMEGLLFAGGPLVFVLTITWLAAGWRNHSRGVSPLLVFGSLAAVVAGALLADHPYRILDSVAHGPFWIGLLGLGLLLAFFDPRLLIALSVDATLKLVVMATSFAAYGYSGLSDSISEALIALVPLTLIVAVGLVVSQRRTQLLLAK